MASQKIWTKDFSINCAICFFVNLAYYMTMVIIADYTATVLHSSLAEAGLACGVFILGTLFARLFMGNSIEKIGLKRSLYIGLFIFLISSLINLFVSTLYPLYIVRFLQGIGFGLSSSTTGIIMAHIVPPTRRGEGTSYYTMFVTLGTAVGPFAGLYLYQNGSIQNNLLTGIVILIVSFIVAYFLNVPKTEYTNANDKQSFFSLQNFIEKTAVPMALVTFFVDLGFAAILGFMASFAKEAGLLEASKYFFLVYALCTVFSRPFTGRWFDSRGANTVMYPSFIIFALSLLLMSQSTANWMLLLAAVGVGLGFGTYMSCSQAIIISIAPPQRMGLATSTFFVFMDLSIGIGPFFLGYIIPFVQFRGIYLMLAIVLVCCCVLYYFVYGRKSTLKEQKNLKQQAQN